MPNPHLKASIRLRDGMAKTYDWIYGEYRAVQQAREDQSLAVSLR